MDPVVNASMLTIMNASRKQPATANAAARPSGEGTRILNTTIDTQFTATCTKLGIQVHACMPSMHHRKHAGCGVR